jgi:hypothetical protein
MYLLLSGEGVSDIGQGRSDAEVCDRLKEVVERLRISS